MVYDDHGSEYRLRSFAEACRTGAVSMSVGFIARSRQTEQST